MQQYTKAAEDKKFIFWINPHTPIEKKLKEDWDTPIHLKSDGPHVKVPLIPHVKVPLIFWFLIMIFYLCFYHQLWVKWVCLDIGNSSGHIGQIHSRFQKYMWSLTPNETHIKFTSFIICSTISQTCHQHLHLKGKKIVLYRVHLIILSTSTETSTY